MNTTQRAFPAKYPGTCSCCDASFRVGAPIVYSDRKAMLVACIEADRAYWTQKDAEDAAFQTKAVADFKAGRRMSVEPGAKWLMVRNAPTYEMAREEALAVVASITAAGGKASIRRHRGRDGQFHVGRAVTHYGQGSNLGHREGWEFLWLCETV